MVYCKSELHVKSELEALSQVLTWFNSIRNSSISRSTWINCQIALAEGFTNVVRHAHKDKDAETPIDIEVIATEKTLQIRIWDQGREFDLKKKLQDLPETAGPEATNGRGIRLIASVIDDFSYTRGKDDRNCLLLVKRLPAQLSNSLTPCSTADAVDDTGRPQALSP